MNQMGSFQQRTKAALAVPRTDYDEVLLAVAGTSIYVVAGVEGLSAELYFQSHCCRDQQLQNRPLGAAVFHIDVLYRRYTDMGLQVPVLTAPGGLV